MHGQQNIKPDTFYNMLKVLIYWFSVTIKCFHFINFCNFSIHNKRLSEDDV
jgi:hypothetical protein